MIAGYINASYVFISAEDLYEVYGTKSFQNPSTFVITKIKPLINVVGKEMVGKRLRATDLLNSNHIAAKVRSSVEDR